MTKSQLLMTAIIIPGVVLGLFTAIEHITGHPKGRRNYFRFSRGIIVSVMMAQLGVLGLGLHREYPRILVLFFTLVYLSGPLEYMRYYTFLFPKKKMPLAVTLPLLPALPLIVLEAYLYSRPRGQLMAIFGELFHNPRDSWVIYPFCASLLVTVLYLCLLLSREIALLNKDTLKGPLLFSIVISAITLLSITVSCLFFITRNEQYILAGAAGLSIAFMVYFLFKNRFPGFFQLFAREMKQERYRRTLLRGLDQQAIHERLSDLMNEEKLYREMDLRMKDVAERLLITPHQLSQLLNERIKTDFRNYINCFRIDEARRLLVGDSSRSIISICFEVGFNSKVSFNNTFRKMTGLSPKEYRERRGGMIILPEDD